VLDHVHGAKLVEGIIGKGQRTAIQVAEDVGLRVGIHVHADRPRILVWAATHVENARQAASRRKRKSTTGAPGRREKEDQGLTI
jgi:hypothetical protein